MEVLALHGGAPVRSTPMPSRQALGAAERSYILQALDEADQSGQDLGYQDRWESRYTEAFVEYLGEQGYADAVCSGTAGLFVALSALKLPEGSPVMLSPVSDPGTLNALLMNRLMPVLVDSAPGSYNMGAEELESRMHSEAQAMLLVHVAGSPAPIHDLLPIAKKQGLALIEDASQAHGAQVGGRHLGTFGDFGVFSTMHTKNHTTGGCGGLVFTKNQNLHRLARAFADRGKPFWEEGFSDRDPSSYLFPALNLNQSELACAIGFASLSRLEDVRQRRLKFAELLASQLQLRSKVCRCAPLEPGHSPFFQVIEVDTCRLKCSKKEFAAAIAAEGIPVRAHYPLVIAEWNYAKPWLSDDFSCPNACAYRDRVFHLLFNEHFGTQELNDILEAIEKVEFVLTD